MRTSSLQAAPFGGDPLQNGTLLGWRWLAPLQSKPLSGAQGIPPHTHTRPPHPTTSTKDPQVIEASDRAFQRSNGVTFPQLALFLPNPAGGILSACNFRPP